MTRDPPASWQRLPKAVIGHITESLCIKALGRCACVGDYKLKSAVATAWCRLAARLAGRGFKNAGAAVEALRRAARERDLRRVSVEGFRQRGYALLQEAPWSLETSRLKARLLIQATRDDGSAVTLDWKDLDVVFTQDGLYLGAAYDDGLQDIDADRLCRQAPTPGGVSPASTQFFAWMRDLATKSQEEVRAATQSSLQASVTVQRGPAVVELARFGARGTPYGGSGVEVLFVDEEPGEFGVMPLLLNLHNRPGEFPLAVPGTWTLQAGYSFAEARVDFSILLDRGSGEPKFCRLDINEKEPGPAPFRRMTAPESARIVNALLDAEVVRAAREWPRPRVYFD